MMKKLLILAMTLLMLVGAGACGGGNPVGNVVDSVVNRLSGDTTGEVGKTYETEWFTFQVNSLETVESYKGVDAEEGFLFLVANIYEKNSWASDDTIPMSCYDFFLFEDDGDEQIFPEEPWDDGMMPSEFYLDPDEEGTYDVVFLILDDVSKISLIYEEVDTSNTTYATFTIEYSL